MPSRKRGADDTGESSGKATKAARTQKKGDGSKRGAKKATATSVLPSADFKAKALPLHLNLTHTPPSILKEDEPGNEGAQLENVMDTINDPGFIGNLTLVPTAFRTGSYGWKGSRRIAVELQDGDTDGEGRKETVEIMLTVNATVVGSKHATSSEGKEKEQELEVVAEDALHDEDE